MAEHPNNGMTDEQARAYAGQQLSSAQTLTTISMLGAPVSLIIGGIPLALVALICGLVALSKVKSAIRAVGKDGISARLLQQAWIGIAISAASIVANAMYLATVMPALLEYLRTGDMDALMQSLGSRTAASSSSSAATSVWD